MSDVSFNNAHFENWHFNPTPQSVDQFKGSVDLRGCTYDRIKVDLHSLMQHTAPYDRESFSHLEGALRRAGDDRAADHVYLTRQKLERKQHRQKRDWGPWLANWSYGTILNYGVRPFQLLYVSLFLLFLGTCLFSRSGATSRSSTTHSMTTTALSVFERWKNGLFISLRLFLPIELPLLPDWKPTRTAIEIFSIKYKNRTRRIRLVPSHYAAFWLRIPGWILVPLGVAAVAGLIR